MNEIQPRDSELLDVVDVFGEPTGQVLDKAAIHVQGLPHRDVHVWITNGTDMLQQRRARDKVIMPDTWDIAVGGHVNAGETYLEAAIRETQEELGLDMPAQQFIRLGKVASQLRLPGWEVSHNIVGQNFALVQPNLAIADLQLQAEEVIDARWYSIDQLEADLVHPQTAKRHAPQPPPLYALGIAGMRAAARGGR